MGIISGKRDSFMMRFLCTISTIDKVVAHIFRVNHLLFLIACLVIFQFQPKEQNNTK